MIKTPIFGAPKIKPPFLPRTFVLGKGVKTRSARTMIKWVRAGNRSSKRSDPQSRIPN